MFLFSHVSLAKRRKSLSGREQGESIVEYALVVILFLTLIFGIVGFGHALYTYQFVNHAAKEATRWAAVNGSTCSNDSSCNGVWPMFHNTPADEQSVKDLVTHLVPPGIDSTKVTTIACGVLNGTLGNAKGTPAPPACQDAVPSFCTAATPNVPGCSVKVQVSYNFNFIVPFIRSSALTMSSTSEMVIVH